MVDAIVLNPPVPGSPKINGAPATDGLNLHTWGAVVTTADIQPYPGTKDDVRLHVFVATNPQFAGAAEYRSAYGKGGTHTVIIPNLAINTQYWFQYRAKQRGVPNLSPPSNVNVWTERLALAPTPLFPEENTTVTEGAPVPVQWTHNDADAPPDPQFSAQINLRTTETIYGPAGPITTYSSPGGAGVFNIPASALKSNTHFEYQIRTSDVHTANLFGPWSQWVSFYVVGSTLPPIPTAPINDSAVAVDTDIAFSWIYRDPSGSPQTRADLRYRAVGTPDWLVINGDPAPGAPGAAPVWTIPGGGALQPGYRYEWQVRTWDGVNASDWSSSGTFWGIETPGGRVPEIPWTGPAEVQGSLGVGTYRVFAFDRGGERIKGEITPINTLRWTRLRDDISTATIYTSGFGDDCCELLGELRTWAHEIVVFRDGVRVWEGPITRIAYHNDRVEIEARDPMVYVYRRIMRQGYNDSNQFIYRPGGSFEHSGARSVVDRAALIIANALAPNDPNVLPWLTRFDFADDAKQSRVVADWAKTAWEEVDSLAATGGLDYTTVGRRIILWDTHRPIGLLPEMREKDFFSPPVITEYGMNAANVFGVTSNSGIWGSASYPMDEWGDLGPIELLASEYGESGAGAASPDALTDEERARKRQVLNGQAARNIDGRWPAPLVARVPDNSRIHPDANVGINQLIPGVFVPLRVVTRCREFAQVQKIDSINVEVTDSSDEAVKIILSPAPTGDIDLDAESAATES